MSPHLPTPVIPGNDGSRGGWRRLRGLRQSWIPAFAGMTGWGLIPPDQGFHGRPLDSRQKLIGNAPP